MPCYNAHMPSERDKEKLQCPRCGGSGVVSVPLVHPPTTETDWEDQACGRCDGDGVVGRDELDDFLNKKTIFGKFCDAWDEFLPPWMRGPS